MSSIVLSHPGVARAALSGRVVRSVKHLPGLLAWARRGNQLWCTSGRRIVICDLQGGSCEEVVALPGSRGENVFPLSRTVARLLRRGVRSCIRLDGGNLLVFSDDRSYYWSADRHELASLDRVARGHGPLVQGCCQDGEGVCYYGDYWGNRNRELVRVWRWAPGDAAWEEYYRFPSGAVRHVHAVQYDPFSQHVWVAAGDRDEESMIGWLSETGHGPGLNVIADGRQGTRAVSLMFTSAHVFWGSDAGRDTDESCNHVFRWSRSTRRVERIAPVGGPVYYSAVDERGRLFLTTAVEGSNSEADRRARLWMSDNGDTWQELMSWEKDRFPLKLGYGVLWFPQDGARESLLCVSGQGVDGGPGTWILEV